ncbi:unnamed protein product [Ceratitis capitata]|uniref:(Mediterranean fruit fly) hypothetical protein n=1 Tax=Ceratitis capitata TaxID=7213 RepID=A0A811UP77_CERCA|nr:unnamed protein product [Ceratitis capitata]
MLHSRNEKIPISSVPKTNRFLTRSINTGTTLNKSVTIIDALARSLMAQCDPIHFNIVPLHSHASVHECICAKKKKKKSISKSKDVNQDVLENTTIIK